MILGYQIIRSFNFEGIHVKGVKAKSNLQQQQQQQQQQRRRKNIHFFFGGVSSKHGQTDGLFLFFREGLAVGFARGTACLSVSWLARKLTVRMYVSVTSTWREEFLGAHIEQCHFGMRTKNIQH